MKANSEKILNINNIYVFIYISTYTLKKEEEKKKEKKRKIMKKRREKKKECLKS